MSEEPFDETGIEGEGIEGDSSFGVVELEDEAARERAARAKRVDEFVAQALKMKPGPAPGTTEMHRIIASDPSVGMEAHRRLASWHTLEAVREYLASHGYSLSISQLHYYRQRFVRPEERLPIPYHVISAIKSLVPRIDSLQVLGRAVALQEIRLGEIRAEEEVRGIDLPETSKALELLQQLTEAYFKMQQALGLAPVPPVAVNLQQSGSVQVDHSGGVQLQHNIEVPETLAEMQAAIRAGLQALAQEAEEAKMPPDTPEGGV